MRTWNLLGFVALLALRTALASHPVGAVELERRLQAGESPLVLDVRTAEEFSAGHISGAVNIPFDLVSARRDELPVQSGTEIVVYCASGFRAGIAGDALRDLGYSEVRDLVGHWQAWPYK